MPLLTFFFDHRGRPVIELYVSQSVEAFGAARAMDEVVPPPQQITALIDTGASTSKVIRSVLEVLGLSPVGTTTEYTASSGAKPVHRELYAVDLVLTEGKLS